jgi:predicted DCC family thiol-disulfide oxidoreductase YuxK
VLVSMTTEGRVAAAAQSPDGLLVLYDAGCPICVRCRRWLETQATYVPLHFLATDSAEAVERFGPHLPWLGKELVVVGDRGQAWIGPAAFLVALWATRSYRLWSYRLSGRSLAPLAGRFFEQVSRHRQELGRWVKEPSCTNDRCMHV